ncbi:ATP-binding protein [Paracoccus pacificus]|uniref:histidine kinase n=1 Tax=Paracoccus pacificus TaxID=1463598 RepID=A0ABW4RAW2_9RHOB
MPHSDSFPGLPRSGLTVLPLLVLPVLLGSFWLASDRWLSGAPDALALIVAGLCAALLILAMVISGASVRRAFSARLLLRRLQPEFEPLAVPVWVADGDGCILYQNPAAARMSGDRRGQPLANAFARLAADPQVIVGQLLARALRDGRARRRLTDATYGQALTAEIRLGGALMLWRIEAAEQAAPPPAEDVQRETASGTTADFDRLPIALLGMDHDGKVTAINAAARRLLGDIPANARFPDLFDGLGRPAADWIAEALDGRSEGRPEVLRARLSPTETYMQITLSRENGGSSGLIAVLSDVTAMKTLEAQFVQSQKMQAIGQLAGGIAHDFNNLLTAITGHCDLLMLRHDRGDPEYADLDQISQNANRAASLVGQLLAFSRKQTLKPTVLDLRETLSDLAHLLNRLVGERVVLSIDHDPGLHRVRADKRQLEQVVMNLVVNARDAMPAGGTVSIRTENYSAKAATPGLHAPLPPGDYVRIQVSDEGCGIAPDKLDKIFEPFYTTKRTGEGTGLGLSTVYGIVKQTGGYIFCDSELDKGTEFTVYLPNHIPGNLAAERASQVRGGATANPADALADDAPAGDAAPVQAHSDQTAENPTDQAVAPAGVTTAAEYAPVVGSVLLVEDEAPVRSFAARALTLRGFSVTEADSAETALDLLSNARLKVDVFVTDVVMPGMDGPAWVRTALKDRPNTRVVFISGYTEDIFNDGQPPIPNATFLPKPFTLSELTATVQKIMSD